MWTNDRIYVDTVMALDRALGPMGNTVVISVEQGVVTLTGHVLTAEQKGEAARAAAMVRGVRAVVARLHVIGEVVSPLNDARLARTVLAALDHVHAGADITVLVEAGWVGLSGVVRTDAVCQEVERALDRVPGIRGVTSELRVAHDGPCSSRHARVA